MLLRGSFRVFARAAVRRFAYWAIAVLGLASRLRRQPGKPEVVRSILVVRLDLLGDVLFTRPLVQGLRDRFPGAHITLLTLPYTGPLAGLFDEIDEVVTIDTNRIRTPRGLLDPRTWRDYVRAAVAIRERDFDIGISVSGPMASLCVFLSGARWRIGYADEAYPFLLTDRVPGGRYGERIHEVDYVRRLASPVDANAPARLELPVSDDARDSMDRKLGALGIKPEDRVVVIHAGAVNGSAKRWPAGSWARFIDRVVHASEAKVVLAGAQSDEAIARAVLTDTRAPAISLVGGTSIEELVALIARADLVASGDSGPLHIAVALGRPLVAAYGPTDPQVHGPYFPRAPTRVHRHDLPCSPCYSMAATAECPLGDPICMRLVTVQQMVDSAIELLNMTAPH
ncbi:MAG TPA: lipopolysaccharide heptosyltransferase II [Chloroflexota bacterium]